MIERRPKKKRQQLQQIINVCLLFGQIRNVCIWFTTCQMVFLTAVWDIFQLVYVSFYSVHSRCVIVVVLLLLQTYTHFVFRDFFFVSLLLFSLSLSSIGDLDCLYFSWCQSIYLPCCWSIFVRCSRSSVVCCVYRFIYLHNELLWFVLCVCMRVEL